jgi:hypothetical protein
MKQRARALQVLNTLNIPPSPSQFNEAEMSTRTNRWAAAYFVVHDYDDTRLVLLSGRDRWALERLMDAGERGCTPIDEPAPRWSGYVFNLRQMGVEIETIHERHGGPFAGTHARYVLRSRVSHAEGNLEAAE